ncbi:MAG: DUF29 domain-containing protein [Gammaproteobacteria bacterium]
MNTPKYHEDHYAWAKRQATLLSQRRLSEIDAEHIAEELEDMGGSERREVVNRLGVLLAHLIKWRYQPDARSSAWAGTIKEQRRKVQRLLADNPSLKRLAEDRLQDAYGDALALVERDTGLDESHFPAACPFLFDVVLDSAFWPE